jgi:class 3 adenylate cyclase
MPAVAKLGLVDNKIVLNNFDLELEPLVRDRKLLDPFHDHQELTVRSRYGSGSHVGKASIVQSFAPDMLLQYALENEFQLHEVKTEPYSVFFDGVVLLADISGFTRLAGKLCSGGKDGLDKLQKVTNDYLGELVNIIYSYKGDVMKFAGDALICVFQPSRYSKKGMTLSDVCSNAVQCATELAQISTDKLTIHVAISCGSICFAMLGGYDNAWECLISGECLGHLHQCLDDAGSQQTVVSSQFVETLGMVYRKELNIEKLPSGNYIVLSVKEMNSLLVRKMIKQRKQMLRQDCEARFSTFPNDASYLKGIECFVPIPVCEALALGSFDYLAELREVTTMFMSWDSYDEKKHKDLLSLQKFFVTAQIILNETGGFIRQFLLDDKGCILIACWGVPTASHPDNARRALSAGTNIGFELNKLDMKTSVGISTGNAFCGSVGSYVRREYTMIGDVVNLAARLMSKAKSTGDVFIDEATYSRLPFFMKRSLVLPEAILLKGQSKPIAAYVLEKDIQFSLNDKEFEEVYLNKMVVRSICKEPLYKGMVEICKDELVDLKVVVMEGNKSSGKGDVLDWLRVSTTDMNIRLINLKILHEDSLTEYSMMSNLFRMLIGEEMFDDPDCQEVVIRHMLRKVYRGDVETIAKVRGEHMFLNQYERFPI